MNAYLQSYNYPYNPSMHNKCIWTLPTSSEQSFSFALVVSAVAFVYPACFGLFALANL